MDKSAKQIDEYAANNHILSSEIIQGKKKLLKEKNTSISIIENQKSSIDKQIKSSFRNFKFFIFFLFIAFYCGTYYLLAKFGWDSFEQWTWIMSTLPIIFYLSYLLIKERQFNPVALLKIQRTKIQMKKYSKFNIDLDLLNKLNDEKTKIENELR